MEKFESKTPEEMERAKHEIFTEIKNMVQERFKCFEPEATAFLYTKEDMGDIYDKNVVEQYLNNPETEKEFNDFRINFFGKFHETPEGQ